MAEVPPQISEPFLRLAVERGYLDASQAERLVTPPSGCSDLDDLDVALRCIREGLLSSEQVIELRRACGHAPVRNFAEFEIEYPIGRGSTGVVYKARRTGSGLRVALKILPGWMSEDNAAVDRFLREAKILGKLNHPNIVKAIDAGTAEGRYYLAMEHLDGGSLRDLVKNRGMLGEYEALRIVRAVAQALRDTLSHGIVHRDVKPRNILFTYDGIPKLADLGLARASGYVPQDGPPRAIGTPNYISPEQASGQADVDVRSDIYSLGATLFYAVTGRPPFEGKDAHKLMAAHRALPIPNPGSINPEISDGCANLILWMMEKDPARRPQKPDDVIARIDRMMALPRLLTVRLEKALFPASVLLFLILALLGAFMIAMRWNPRNVSSPLRPPIRQRVEPKKVGRSGSEVPADVITPEQVAETSVNPYKSESETETAEQSKPELPPKPPVEPVDETTEPEPISVTETEPAQASEHPGDTSVEPSQATAVANEKEEAVLAPYYSLVYAITPFLEERRYKEVLDRLDQALESGALNSKVRDHVLWEQAFVREVANLFNRTSNQLLLRIDKNVEFEFRKGIRASGKLTRVDRGGARFQMDGGGYFEIKSLSVEFIVNLLELRAESGQPRLLVASLMLADGSLYEAERELNASAAEGVTDNRLLKRLERAKKRKARLETEQLNSARRDNESSAMKLFTDAETAYRNQALIAAAAKYRKLIREYGKTETAKKNRESIQDHFVQAAHAVLKKRGVTHASAVEEPEDKSGVPTYLYYFEKQAEEEMKDFDCDSTRWRIRRGALEHFGTDLWKYPVRSRVKFERVDEIHLTYRVDFPNRLGISFCGISVVFFFVKNQVAIYAGELVEYRSKVQPEILGAPPAKSKVETSGLHSIRIIRNGDRFRILIDESFMEDVLIPDAETAGHIEIRDNKRCRIADIKITAILEKKWAKGERARLEDAIAKEAEF
ncbi:MAG: serine/threonine protein kinase [Planctomycetota bacterium]|nr:MAG: serine/threonine protein kinase [Planctomycetota bacterium]